MKNMNRLYSCYLGFTFILLCGTSQNLLAQNSIEQLNAKDSLVSSSWIIGVGINIVDDSGDNGLSLGSIGDSWNILPFPSRLSVGKYFDNGLGVELIGTANIYRAGKIIDRNVLSQDEPYWAVDSRLSYDLNYLVGETGIFDPYAGVGFGYTHASGLTRSTLNAAVGFRLWATSTWGIDINAMGKWWLDNSANSNHIQYGAGFVVRPKMKQKLSPRGQEKLERIQRQLEEEQQRLDAIKKAAEEEALRATREREALEAAEAARRAAQKPDISALQTQLDSKGYVYYELNKAALNTSNKTILAAIAEFMHSNEDLKFEVHGHADSRGSQAYNLTLSEKRAEATVSYLISLGINADRLTAIGHGESDLLNNCTDHVRCSEADHAVNRRSELKIIGN